MEKRGLDLIEVIGSIVGVIVAIFVVGFKLGAKIGRIEDAVSWIKQIIFSKFIKEPSSRNYVRSSTSYKITTEGERILHHDLKKEIKKIVKSEEFKKIIKKDKSPGNITPFIASRIGWERLEEVADAAEIETPTASLVVGAYAIKCWEETPVDERVSFFQKHLHPIKKYRRKEQK